MKEINVLVIDPVGLHARPATVAVNAASKFKCDVQVSFKGKSVNMKSIMVVWRGVLLQNKIKKSLVCSGLHYCLKLVLQLEWLI